MPEDKISYKAFTKLKKIYNKPDAHFISTKQLKKRCTTLLEIDQQNFVPFVQERGPMNNLIGSTKELGKPNNIFSYIEVTKILRKAKTKNMHPNIDIDGKLFPNIKPKTINLSNTQNDSKKEESPPNANAGALKFKVGKKPTQQYKKKKHIKKSVHLSNAPQISQIKQSESPGVGHYNVDTSPTCAQAYRFSTVDRGITELPKPRQNSLDDIELPAPKCKGYIQNFGKQIARYKKRSSMNMVEDEVVEIANENNPLPFYAMDDSMTERMKRKDAKVIALLTKIKGVMMKQNII